MSNVSFPPEVLENIFSHLSVKSLLQYRSVSKSLRAIIDSPYFINLHSQQSMKTNKALAYFRGVGFSTFICSLHMDLNPSCVKLETPFNIADFPQIIGSCNGLIGFSTGKINREILFWNPSTRKHKSIPTPIHDPHIVRDQLGYDHVNDDYKVLRLSMVSVPAGDFKFTVYSMRLNAWRLVEHDLPTI
ncbi:F-box protein At4g22390-like [Bidens hawaiensis]|uniref:F-box protein At4g22390-like n=1 Tax=Bidens hawaiensis TaxID=980011 RepID=UPI0040494C01